MSTAPVWPGRRPRCTWPPSRTLQRSRRSRPLACSGELLLWRLRLLRGRPYRDLDVAGLEVDTTKAVRAFRGVDDEHLLELTLLTLVAQARLDDLERVGHETSLAPLSLPYAVKRPREAARFALSQDILSRVHVDLVIFPTTRRSPP